MTTTATDHLSRALDRLYGVPLEDFLALRKQLAGELKAAGEADASKTIAAAPKPTRTAWALNQVSRRQPELATALLRSRDEAFAPAPGDADGLRQAMRDYRERISDIVRAARDLMVERGMELNAIQLRRMTETLQAACAKEGGARTQLLNGTLARDAEADDPLALLAAGAADPPKKDGAEKPSAKRGPDPAIERKRDQERRDREQQAQALAAARARVTELEGASREALARMRTAQSEANRAARELDLAKRAVEEADARLAEARKKVTE